MNQSDLYFWKEFLKGVHPLNGPMPPFYRIFQSFIPEEKYPDRIDLHGLTVQEAFTQFEKFLENCQTNNVRKVTVITGKSGQIRQEFFGWLDNPKLKSKISETKKKNEGSFTVKLKKI